MARLAGSSPIHVARSGGRGFVYSTTFEVLARGGLVARGVVHGLIGILALEVAVADTGRLTNQQGALEMVANEPFGVFLLVLLAIGLGGYAIWRLFRAVLGYGREDTDSAVERLGALASGLAYGGLCVVAIELLTGSSNQGGSASASPRQATAGVFDWPAGRWLVGIVGLVVAGVGVYQLVQGFRRTFLDDLETDEMSPETETVVSWIGVVAHIGRGIVFGLVGCFLVKAAYEHDPNDAVGLDGALTKVPEAPYGPWLLGCVAAGLIGFGLYSLVEARYSRI